MLVPYKPYLDVHQTLHEFMMDFFKAIINFPPPFSDKIFHTDFRAIAKSHKKIIYTACETIYNEFKKLPPAEQKELSRKITDSNEIEKICSGIITPLSVDDLPESMQSEVKTLFTNLYESILRGDNKYTAKYGKIRKHFDEFVKLNAAVTICPFCGIVPFRTDEMEEYDHYLPKSVYPFSAINLLNLVPTCKNCNQTDKKAKDVLKVGGKKIFYPYDQSRKPVNINLSIKNREPELSDCGWDINFSSDVNCEEEFKTWDAVYKIKTRYCDHAKRNGKTWYEEFFNFKQTIINETGITDLNLISKLFLSGMTSMKNMLNKAICEALFRDTDILAADKESTEYRNTG